MKSPTLFAILLAVAGARAVHADDPLIHAIETQVKANEASAATQQNVDALRDQTQRMLEEYRDALRQTEVLNAYNDHLRRLVESQRAEMASLEQQAKAVETTRRDLVPLMLRMTDTLERFVRLDRPFLLEERLQRVAELNGLMNQADVNNAEKFRRVLQAYQDENDYGKTIEAYRAELKGDDNHTRTVDFLRIGRVGLFYQTLDEREAGAWNHQTHRWEKLPPDYTGAIRKGLSVARKESPAELLTIAVNPPVDAP